LNAETPPFLHLQGLTKRFGRTLIFQDVDLGVDQGSLVSIIGPSGAGKTTLLHIIAGLEPPTAGLVRLSNNGSRPTAILVFQDYVLFPTMTVRDNVAFGLRARKLPKTLIRDKVQAMLGHFHLEDRAEAYPAQLSGGQKQRVAIARAMVVEPDLLLLDEPFANLDRNLKLETALFIRSTQRSFGITTICVTHDLQEALAMSDRIGVMLGGRLRQYAPPLEVYRHPVDMDTARFLGPVNTITPDLARMLGITACWLRPEALRLRPDPDGPGAVIAMHFAGHFLAYTVRVLDQDLTVYTLEPVAQPGDRVSLSISDQYPPIFTHTAEASCSIE
jgi:putative spermidine/putrescine transport system ATP-binding protein